MSIPNERSMDNPPTPADEYIDALLRLLAEIKRSDPTFWVLLNAGDSLNEAKAKMAAYRAAQAGVAA